MASEDQGVERIVAESRKMLSVLEMADIAAGSNVTVLIEGETGVGKDLVAQYIHSRSPRHNGSFVCINCGAIPESLFESEIFGHQKGAFTNAFSTHKGCFEQANGGTIFLDEISEMPLNTQAKLLRIMESKMVKRIGGEVEIPLDARIVSATNNNLREQVKKKLFRQDLYYRLAVCVIFIPPLRQRVEDIKPLAEYFLDDGSGLTKVLSDNAISKLCRYQWPGNVRELQSCIMRSILFSNGSETISENDLQLGQDACQYSIEGKARLEETLKIVNGDVKKAAQLMGVHRNTIYYQVRKFGINIGMYKDQSN